MAEICETRIRTTSHALERAWVAGEGNISRQPLSEGEIAERRTVGDMRLREGARRIPQEIRGTVPETGF